MMNNDAMGAFRPSKNIVSIVAAVAMSSMVAGCQSMDTTETNSVLIKPVVHAVRSQPAVQPAQARFLVRSLRAEPQILMTSTIRTTERDFAFASPQRIKVRTPAPVKVSFNPGDGGTFLGGSPYICSPSGFGQRASCRPRYL
ncbi:hypothetical protein NKJ06_00330 [Mesorhizobium sp. M0293]|uniref:hypothetical protein n=1 Tax=unclassified Mesorhizobium TaxID=325217 RepID=UPI0033354D9A